MHKGRMESADQADVVHFVIHHEDPMSRPDWAEEIRSDAVYEGATRARLERTSDDGLTVTAPRQEFRLWERVATQNGADVRVLPLDAAGSGPADKAEALPRLRPS